MQSPQPAITPHRFARIVLWAKRMLAWVALTLHSESAPRVMRRHIRQRYGFISLAWIERLVGALALIRAAKIARLKPLKRAPAHTAAPSGFHRRAPRAGGRRATLGGRFRKALKRRDPRERLHCLLSALSDIDAFARRYLVKRGLRRLTRRRPLIIAAPPAQPLESLTAAAVGAADTW